MTIHKATFENMDKILIIYARAREQMRLSGNPGQWGDHYPSLEIVQKDIENGNSYVITDAEDE
ncbi:MAG: GNAT family acetyltransferase, partial [Lachnospiraceae bacterium]|nr:GNAT family acetyltransferase [Lachnospiraceae bacterium]